MNRKGASKGIENYKTVIIKFVNEINDISKLKKIYNIIFYYYKKG